MYIPYMEDFTREMNESCPIQSLLSPNFSITLESANNIQNTFNMIYQEGII